jgi:hypothetical protein
MENKYKFQSESLKEKGHYGNLYVGGKNRARDKGYRNVDWIGLAQARVLGHNVVFRVGNNGLLQNKTPY